MRQHNTTHHITHHTHKTGQKSRLESTQTHHTLPAVDLFGLGERHKKQKTKQNNKTTVKIKAIFIDGQQFGLYSSQLLTFTFPSLALYLHALYLHTLP